MTNKIDGNEGTMSIYGEEEETTEEDASREKETREQVHRPCQLRFAPRKFNLCRRVY